MSRAKIVFLVLLAIGCIGLVITLSILLTRNRYDCYLGSDIIPITGITFVQLDTHVLVTWNRPYEMNTCHQGYEVTYSSINGKITTTTQAESITIPDRNICFEFDITIRPITASSNLSYGKATFHDQRELDVQYTIPTQNPSQVIITWTHPNQEWCSLLFMVSYQTPSDNLVVNVTVPEVIFDFVYCTPASLTIRGINPNDGNLVSPQSATVDATQYPENLEYIRYTNMTTRDNEMEISWNPTEPIGACNFTYQVVFTTDLGKFTQATEEPHIVLSRDFFCFDVKAVIQAVAGKRAVDIGNTGVTYGIAAVDDLELNVFNANSTVRATWSHPFEGRCGVNYEVAFLIGKGTTYIFKRSLPNINFDLFYCVNTTVNVRALRPDGGASQPRNVTNSEEYPTSLEPVQNVTVSRNGTSAVLSWKTSNFVINCDNLYNVTARNDKTSEESTCQGTAGCEISLTNLCPQTIFRIKPASYLEGKEVIEMLTC